MSAGRLSWILIALAVGLSRTATRGSTVSYLAALLALGGILTGVFWLGRRFRSKRMSDSEGQTTPTQGNGDEQ